MALTLSSQPLDLGKLAGTDSLRLTLPQMQSRVSVNKEQLSPLAKAHAVFYLTDCDGSELKASKRAVTDIAAIRTAFPAVEDSSVILAMAAWFALLCNVDDEIEQMEYETARLALVDSVSVLEASLRDGRRSPVGYGGACLDPRCDKIRALTKTFVRLVRGLLPRATYASLVVHIAEVWEAMRLERTYIDSCNGLSLQAYLDIRSKTIGLRPFFVLLQYNLDCCELSASEEISLQLLETEVVQAVGLQNDLTGLGKDLTMGQQALNFVTVVADTPGFGLDAGLRKAVDMHNTSVLAASRQVDQMEADWSSDATMEYADALLGFVGRHFLWASSAKRYEPVQPLCGS